ncbi:RNA polymerase subunit sigma [Paenibacillus albidus]|uniref:RNA polymerase sigma factor n=1 Tax=Paenibacillus albidus TaxID=2041023 RepID=A0A917BZE5_9BACL|nr:sigma-70 family RNA polymerase sigma factor [Paenibacillus albidus]GGF63157.1 RNA polymerase subunit sigma [Paenibacillus albidus]
MKEYSITEQQAREMFEEHASYVYGIALMITKLPALADDITQETFLRAYSKYHRYDESRPIRPWLYRITVNMTRDVLRRKSWQKLFSRVPETDTAREQSAESIVMHDEAKQQLWSVVGRLSQKQREVVTLHYYAGLPLPETAAVLGIPLGTCKSRLHMALTKLRLYNEQEPELFRVREGLK